MLGDRKTIKNGLANNKIPNFQQIKVCCYRCEQNLAHLGTILKVWSWSHKQILEYHSYKTALNANVEC